MKSTPPRGHFEPSEDDSQSITMITMISGNLRLTASVPTVQASVERTPGTLTGTDDAPLLKTSVRMD